MNEIPQHLMKSTPKCRNDERQQRNKTRSIYKESTGLLSPTNRSCPRNEKKSGPFETKLSIPKNKTKGKVSTSRKKDIAFGDNEDSGDITTSTSVLTHLTKFRKDRSEPRDSSTLTDVDLSSTEIAEGLSTGSILELYDTTIRSDNAKLKRLQMEIRRDYVSCFLKLEITKIATLCSTPAKLFLKPCPKFFMVNNEPCYEELKSVLKSIKCLKNIMISKHTALLENRMLLDVLHWVFFESKIPSLFEIQFVQTHNELQKIDVLRFTLKPSLIAKVKYGQYSNQEVDHRYYLKYLRQSKEDFEIRLGYVAVHLQRLYQVLANGIDILIQDKKGVAIYSNFIASIDSIRDNVYYLMNSNYSNGSNIVFEYFAVLVTEIVVQRENDNHTHDVSIYRNTINVNDCVYFVKNVKRIKTKFIFFYKMGSNKMFKKLMCIDKKMQTKFILFTPTEEKLDGQDMMTQMHCLVISLAFYFVGILISLICFVWYMKTWRYF